MEERKLGKQLYSAYESVDLPDKAMPALRAGGFVGKRRTVDNFILMRWPNGRPCHLANLWIAEICSSTGARDSARVSAGLITHLIRYCFIYDIGFCNFGELEFEKLTEQLIVETVATSTGFKHARNNNRTRQIQQRTLDFLYWVTIQYPKIGKFPLVGEENSGANITVSFEVNPKNKRSFMDHPLLASPVPYNDDKVPIDDYAIQKIQDEIFRRHDWEDLPLFSRLKLTNDLELYVATNTYIYERRMFTMRMMKLMGMRPEELFDLDLKLNRNISETKEIVAPTKKRGTPAPIRRFKINAASVRQFLVYVDARQTYIDFLQSRNIFCAQPDNIFLGEHGRHLKKESITKEFDRLCEGAGLSGIRVCLSMFRHRFVTRQISIRLESKFRENPAYKNGWTPGLRDEICRDVAQLTGHADSASLFHYFHAEYKDLTSSSSYSAMLEAQDELDSIKDTLTSMEHKSKLQKVDLSNDIKNLRAMAEKLEMQLNNQE